MCSPWKGDRPRIQNGHSIVLVLLPWMAPWRPGPFGPWSSAVGGQVGKGEKGLGSWLLSQPGPSVEDSEDTGLGVQD